MRQIKLWTALTASLALWAQSARKIPVGGQAVIEGVLMKGADLWGLAVRQPDGKIFKEKWNNSSRTKNYPWKLPLLRGFITMIEMMGTGFRALNRSAEIALADSEEKLTKRDFFIAVAVAVFAVVGLFVALPLWIAEQLSVYFSLSAVGRNVLEGVTRGGVFISYVAAIGLWGDIEQVFRYHGAEHKTINAFENGLELTPQAVASQSRIHPRCGTSFLLIAVIVSIAVFSFIGGRGLLWRIGSRVLLLPLVVGISYEIIRFASKSGFIGKIFMSPVLILQYLTTRQPDLGQIEVALVSLNVALKLDAAPNAVMSNKDSAASHGE